MAGNSPQISAQIQQVLSPDSKSVFSFILQTWVVVCQIGLIPLWAEELPENLPDQSLPISLSS